ASGGLSHPHAPASPWSLGAQAEALLRALTSSYFWGDTNLRLVAILLLAATLLPAPALAGGGPENVFLVVNEDSWASQTVANEYVHLRRIPMGCVLYLSGLSSFEGTDVNTFRKEILEPVFAAIKSRGLTDQIDYIVYSSDLPWGIGVHPDVGKKELPKFITKRASINGLTYLHELVRGKDIAYLSLASNWYYRRPLRPVDARPWTEADRAERAAAHDLLKAKKWAEAVHLLRALAEKHPAAPQVHYNLACGLARLGKGDEAMAALRRALRAGWTDADHTRDDADLASLRDRDDFKRLLEAMKQPRFDLQPAVAFRSADAWSRRGNRTEPHAGRRYMLSTMLAVTSGRGNSLDEVRTCLRRSAAADGSKPSGTVYLMKNRNVRSRTREWAFATTVALLRERGVRAEIRNGVLPKERPDVAGAVIGSGNFDWPGCGSTILPGAICEHLTSSGGVMSAGAGQTCLSVFLRHGAAGASGTVTEPMAIQAKFPSPLMHVHYAEGASLAEAFYQSIAGPYQLLIVGDPLCRPWATIPEVTVKGVRPGGTVKGTVHLEPGTNNLKPDAVDHYEVLLWGTPYGRCGPGGTIDIDTTTFSDGFYEFRLVAVAADRVRTRGFLEIPVTVNHKGVALQVTAPEEKRIVRGEPLRLSAALPGAREIRFMHHARVLAAIEGERGEAEIDTQRLGFGPVRILPVAHLPPQGKVTPSDFAPSSKPAAPAGGSIHVGDQIVAAPIEVEIAPPPALGPVAAPPEKERVKGLKLVTGRGEAVHISGTLHGRWLGKAGMTAGGGMTLEGFFHAPHAGLYQFQVRTGGRITIEVDGTALETPVPGRWAFVPVHLAEGTHRLRIEAVLPKRSGLDLRFGRRGTRPLGPERWFCTGPFTGTTPPDAQAGIHCTCIGLRGQRKSRLQRRLGRVNRPVTLGHKLLDSKPSKRRERRTVVLPTAVNRDET
ncbi:MAG: hypothetical protein R6X20_09160, partial [Phycisphaerae bacterium]